ncbi:hypothetical protein [Streptomyces sp. SLBN-8D4]
MAPTREFWRTIQLAVEKDTWTARLVVVLLLLGATTLGACVLLAAH